MDFDARDDSRDRDDFDVYNKRWLDDPRDLDDRERDLAPDHDPRDHDPREPFVAALELPHGLERELIQDARENLYELNGDDSRMLATPETMSLKRSNDCEVLETWWRRPPRTKNDQ